MADASAEVLSRLSGGPRQLWLVLYEDVYETTFGDGKFLYPAAAFWSSEDALRWMAAAPPPIRRTAKECALGYRLTMKPVSLSMADGRLKADLSVGPCERYSLADVLRRLAQPMRFEGDVLRG
ncbi:MAG: hypothetical protein KGO96_08590 [Elusimicrobia bacterium]|nr:hypothetical protein [Elusimicrobiota bacterium]MDE2238069.1 hypothetical protein [Elusimicrobiota bacterium]MDE2425947.1 hypothetical protein [Elusimicrobiota bacterium]